MGRIVSMEDFNKKNTQEDKKIEEDGYAFKFNNGESIITIKREGIKQTIKVFALDEKCLPQLAQIEENARASTNT